MDLASRVSLLNALLCCTFLFGLLLLRWKANNMGFKSRLDVMQSHSKAQQHKTQRSSLTKTGLLCDGMRSILEDNFVVEKSRLLQRTCHLARASPSKFMSIFKHNVLSARQYKYDPLNIPLSRFQDVHETEDVEQRPASGIGSFPMAMSYEALTHTAEAINATASLCKQPVYETSIDNAFTTLNERFQRQPVAPMAMEHINTYIVGSNAVATRQELPFNALATLQELPATEATMPTTGEGSLLCAVDQGRGYPHKEKEVPVYKRLLEKISSEDNSLRKLLQQRIELEEVLLHNLRHTREALFKKVSQKEGSVPSAGLTPLLEEEEELVNQALSGADRNEVLVQHERSNIDLTRITLQCLKPGRWLNDEVINLYLELLKERELREPKVYLNCHFFNTFFFNKLYKDAHSYDFKAVKRWTTQRRLGYSLIECDKIFVPIHKDVHWCLAVINMREKKLQYLDSLKGEDMDALRALARYIKDEAKDKLNRNLAVDSWELECLQDIPEQLNGCDCGMFMIKYADFLSRGDKLTFSQEHVKLFRRKTVLELLQLRAR